MKKILITEPNLSQAIAIAKFVKRYGDYYIVGLYIKKSILIKNKFLDEVVVGELNTLDLSNYLYILPMGALSTKVLFDEYKTIGYFNGIQFTKSNLLASNKIEMLELANALDVPVPITYTNYADVNKFPIFYKEKYEKGGGDRGVANYVTELPNSSNLIYQEYIENPSTYGVAFIAQNGKIITYSIHQEVSSIPIEGGSAVYITNFFDKRILDYTERLLFELNYNGWGLVEFKFCSKRQDFVFMEINAKFWASIEFHLLNNNNFLFQLLGIEYPEKPTNKLLFLNRLIDTGFQNIFKHAVVFCNSKVVVEYSLINQILSKILPSIIKNIIKKIKYD